jgi:hypothetical protein
MIFIATANELDLDHSKRKGGISHVFKENQRATAEKLS